MGRFQIAIFSRRPSGSSFIKEGSVRFKLHFGGNDEGKEDNLEET